MDDINNENQSANDFLDLEGIAEEQAQTEEASVEEEVTREEPPVVEQDAEDVVPVETVEEEIVEEVTEDPVEVGEILEEPVPTPEAEVGEMADPVEMVMDPSKSGSKYMDSAEDEFMSFEDIEPTPEVQESVSKSQTFAEGLWGDIVGASQVSGDMSRGVMKGVAKGAVETAQFLSYVESNLRKIDPLTHLGDVIGLSDPAAREQAFNDAQQAYQTLDQAIDDTLETQGTVGEVSSSLAQLGVGLFGAGKFRKGWETIAKAPKTISNLTEGGLAMMLGMDETEKNLSNVIQEYPETANWVTEMLAIEEGDGYGERKFKQFVDGAIGVAGADLLIKAMPMIRKLAPFGWKKTDKGVAMKTAKDQLTDYSKFLPKKEAKELKEYIGNNPGFVDIAKGSKDMVIDTYRAFLISGSPPLQVLGGINQLALRTADIAFGRLVTKVDDVVGGRILGGKAGIQRGEFIANLQGMQQGFLQSAKAIKQVIKTGESAFEGIMRGETGPRGVGAHMLKMDPNTKVGKIIDSIGMMPNVIYKTIGVVDEAATYTAFSGAVRGLALRKAAEKLGIKNVTAENMAKVIKEQEKLLRNPKMIIESGISGEAAKVAQKIGLKETPGAFAKRLNDIRNTIPLGRVYVPIFKTIGNLTRQGFERFPGSGLLFKGPKAMWDKGGADRAEVIGSMMTGTTILSSFAGLYQSGVLNGAGEFGKWGVQKAAGFIPYSFNLEGQNVSYNNLDVVGVMFKTAADFMGAIDVLTEIADDEDQDLVDAITGATLYMGRAMANQAYGQSIIEFANLLSEAPTKNVGKTSRREINKLLANLAVPNVVSRFAQAFDPYQREADALLDRIKKRVPGLSKDLPIKYDVFGRPLENSREGVLGALNPLPTGKKTESKFDDFILENNINVTPLYKTQTFDTVKMDMRKFPEVYSELNKTIGEVKIGGKTMSESLEDLVAGDRLASRRFRDDLPENQAKKVQAIVRKYRRLGKQTLLRNNIEFRTIVRNERRLAEKDRRDAERMQRER